MADVPYNVMGEQQPNEFSTSFYTDFPDFEMPRPPMSKSPCDLRARGAMLPCGADGALGCCRQSVVIDGDYRLETPRGKRAERWRAVTYQNQFNPFIKETIPPKIENVDIKTDVKTHWDSSYLIPIFVIDHSWSKIKVEISDVSEFTVKVKVLDNGKYVTFTGKGNEEFEAIIDIDYLTDYLVDYKVKVTATDVAGNKIEWEKEIDGLFGGVHHYSYYCNCYFLFLI